MRIATIFVALSVIAAGAFPASLAAQSEHSHHHDMQQETAMEAVPAGGGTHDHVSHPAMRGMYGAYPMSRESSGTSWQPDSSPLEGIHVTHQDWIFILDALAHCTFNDQGGPRGDERTYSTNMLMFMLQRTFSFGTFGLRAMGSLEPTLGRDGYPLLLQTGETADGTTHLIDRQHPHDAIMELAATYSIQVTDNASAFFYFGVPGEPCLGPPVFMQRFSGEDMPEAPITHHWLDSTHITYGVITFGLTWDWLKLENSFFRGREPDQFRWNIETPGFDSYAVRLSVNPVKDLALQVSYGHLESPEQLSPDVDVDRLTASVMYNVPLRDGNWQTTFAYGLNCNEGGRNESALLLESELLVCKAHTFFARGEMAQKDELFAEDDPLYGMMFKVNKVSGGYIFDFFRKDNIVLGIGASGSLCLLPDELDNNYGDSPRSYLIFIRLKTR